jgi:hypothetical protein
MKLELQFGWNHLWAGIYWETWPEPFRRDIWIAVPFVCLHIIMEKK